METLPSKPLISFLRISLISDGLISAIVFCRYPDVQELTCEPLLCLFEASCKAAVVNFSAEFRGHSAEKSRVNFHGWNYFLRRDPLQTPDPHPHLTSASFNRNLHP